MKITYSFFNNFKRYYCVTGNYIGCFKEFSTCGWIRDIASEHIFFKLGLLLLFLVWWKFISSNVWIYALHSLFLNKCHLKARMSTVFRSVSLFYVYLTILYQLIVLMSCGMFSFPVSELMNKFWFLKPYLFVDVVKLFSPSAYSS